MANTGRGTPKKPYTDAIGEAICGYISEGMSARKACKTVKWAESAFYRRLAEDEGLREKYARAKELAQDAQVDEMRELADTATAENWQVRRLQIDTRKWTAARLAPKKYGDRQQIDLNAQIEQLPDAEIVAELAALRARLGDDD